MDKGSQLFLLLSKMKAPILSKDPIPIPVLCVSVCHSRATVAGCGRCLHDLRCPRVGATETSTHPAPWPPDTAAAAATTAAATTRRTMTSIPPRNPTHTQARSCGYTTRQLFNVYFMQDLLCASTLHNFHFPSFSNYLMLNMTLPNVDCRILSRYIFKYLTDCDFWAISW